jgi:5'-phosphate synthase pdxT subunit
MRKASESELLLPALFDWMQQFPEKPVLGTCAGAILLANPGDNHQPFVDADISRNAWGRQRNSFEAEVTLSPLILDVITPISRATLSIPQQRDKFNHKPLNMAHEAAQLNESEDRFPGIFIRAPRFEQQQINCHKIATMEDEVVGIMQGNKVAVTFHPELTLDRRFHNWLITNCIS